MMNPERCFLVCVESVGAKIGEGTQRDEGAQCPPRQGFPCVSVGLDQAQKENQTLGGERVVTVAVSVLAVSI